MLASFMQSMHCASDADSIRVLGLLQPWLQ